MKFRKIHYSIFFIFITLLVPSQNRIKISRISQDDGLSQGSNYFRFEDSHGYMWMTGNDALNRYDGSTVKVYNLNYFFKNCTPLQQGYGFAESENNLFVGSTRGLYIYDYKADQFTCIDVYNGISDTKTAIPICYYKGKIWCFNENWILISFDVKTKAVNVESKIYLKPIKSVHVYDNEGNSLYQRMPFLDNHGNICFVSSNDLVVYNIQNKSLKKPLKSILLNNEFKILCTAYDKLNDELLLSTNGNYIYRFSKQYSQYKYIKTNDKIVSNIAFFKDKIAYQEEFATPEIKKNYSVNISNLDFQNVKKIENLKPGHSFSFDKIGRLWLCEDGYGQAIVDFKGSLLPNSNQIQQSNIHLKNGVGRFLELHDSTIFFGQLYVFNPKNETYTEFKKLGSVSYYNPYTKEYFSFNDYWNKDCIITILDENFRKIKEYKFEQTKIGLFQHIIFIKDEFPLIAFSNGLFWLNTKTKSLEKTPILPDTNPFYISPIRGNKLIISYLNHPAVLAELQEGHQFKIIKKILPGVQSFYFQQEYSTNRTWVGTNEGVYILDKNYEIYKKFDSNNGLAGTYIYGLLIDNFGKVWCSHQHGLSSIDIQTNHIVNFDKEDGIQEWDFNNRSFLKSTDGTLYFGGVNGFNYIKPPVEMKTFYNPEIYLDKIMVNNKRYIAKQGINLLDKINLKFNENNISIHALVKDLEYGKVRELCYRIKNIDSKWIRLPLHSPINFNALSPGNYLVEFAISDKFNPVITPTKFLKINIEKAFYQTYWFWIVLSGLVFGGGIYWYNLRKFAKQLAKDKQKWELENQRSKITADLHDDIGATLSSLQINSSIANTLIDKNKMEDAQKILLKIETQTQKLSEKIGDIVWSLKPNSEALMTLSTRIKNTANEILGSTEMNYQIKIDEEINEILHDFTERKNMVLITKEALNNIVKYSCATDVFIDFEKFDFGYLLSIQDNGVGFAPDFKKGNGLQNMKRRTEEMGGEFELISEKGTTIKITIPKNRD